MTRKHSIDADEVALAACRALLRSTIGRGGRRQARRAQILARFALAMDGPRARS